MTNTETLTHTAQSKLPNAYAPYSNHPVAAAAVVINDNGTEHIFTGVNVENVIPRMAVCAETSLISNIYNNLGRTFTIKEIVIVGPSGASINPCGACRATLVEHVTQETLINEKTITDYLPHNPAISLSMS